MVKVRVGVSKLDEIEGENHVTQRDLRVRVRVRVRAGCVFCLWLY